MGPATAVRRSVRTLVAGLTILAFSLTAGATPSGASAPGHGRLAGQATVASVGSGEPAQAGPDFTTALSGLGEMDAGPGLDPSNDESWTTWAIKSVGGGLVGWGISKGFNEILVAAGADRTTNALKEMNAKLDQIKASLDQLHEKVDQLIKEVREVNFREAMAPVEHLEGRVWEAQNQFKAVLNIAGQPDKRSEVQEGIGIIKNLVNTDIAPDYAVIPKALLGTAGQTSAYQLFSTYVASQKSIFTWRDSAAIHNFFQYLVNLQALQFNLVTQVRSLTPNLWPPSCPEPPEPPDPRCTQSIFGTYGRPYLGPKADVLAIAQGAATTTKVGSLYDEMQRQLKLLPKGAMIQPASRTEWSVDVPRGAKEFAVQASGSGYPICNGSQPHSRVSCLADLPDDAIGVDPTYRSPGSVTAQLASVLSSAGYGAADQWVLPSMAQLQGLFAGWTPSKGSPKNWLEAESGSDPSTCTPTKPGTDQATSDVNACLWPVSPSRYWSASSSQSTQGIDWKPPQQALQSDIVRYSYRWAFGFLNLTNNSQDGCSLSSSKLDWSALADRLHALDYQFRPQGLSMNLPRADQSCGGTATLVRQIPLTERYF